jgi:hypothetical protein
MKKYMILITGPSGQFGQYSYSFTLEAENIKELLEILYEKIDHPFNHISITEVKDYG